VYNVVGGKVTWEKTGSNNPIYYSYDASGSLWGMQYNGSMYFYVRNAQGDIIKLINSSGVVVVEYAYDAWGRLMSTTGSLAGTLGVDNPYRYRGYRFDTETGLYYLLSRYYNPQWGRFINADELVGVAGTIGSHNIFAYCFNSPVIYSDEQGQYPSYSFNYEYDLGRGWFARFDRGGAGRSPQDHVHVYNKYEEYKQNKDGAYSDDMLTPNPVTCLQ
jgi:RHS repeat-associated protein